MANTRQAEKRVRRDVKKRSINRYHVSRMRTYIKKFKRMIQAGDLEAAEAFLPEVVSIIQHTASKGAIHKREASRRVSRLYSTFNKALKTVKD